MTDLGKSLGLDNISEELKDEAVHDAARDAVAAMDAEDVCASAILTMAFAMHQKLTVIATDLISDFDGEKKVDDAVNDMSCAAACFVLGNAIVAYSCHGAVRKDRNNLGAMLMAVATGQHMMETATELGKLLGESLLTSWLI